jgi:hypothetical protein
VTLRKLLNFNSLSVAHFCSISNTINILSNRHLLLGFETLEHPTGCTTTLATLLIETSRLQLSRVHQPSSIAHAKKSIIHNSTFVWQQLLAVKSEQLISLLGALKSINYTSLIQLNLM